MILANPETLNDQDTIDGSIGGDNLRIEFDAKAKDLLPLNDNFLDIEIVTFDLEDMANISSDIGVLDFTPLEV